MTAMSAQKPELWCAEKLIDMLENADLPPWRKPWNAGRDLPRNAKTNRPYSGMNLWMLMLAPFGDKRFLTPNQVKEAGGTIKEGEKVFPVYFWSFPNAKDQKAGKRPFCKYYKVVNLEQTEGVDLSKLKSSNESDIEAHEHTPIENCESIVKGFKSRPKIEHIGNVACYSPSFDVVKMPEMKTFDKVEEYYSTLFHELGHSTGHESRLNRQELMGNLASFGSHAYSQEELVAEFTAAMLCGEAGIEPQTLENSAAYIKGWHKRLKGNPEALVMAVRCANKAIRLILNKDESEEKEEAA
jgi:antirestriction protein ArdC